MIGSDHDREDQSGEDWDSHDDEPLETEQLELDDEDERLPWLESSEDEEEYEGYGGSDTGRMVLMFVAAVALLAAIVFGIYKFTHRGPDPALIADGSTIPAPEGPYKEVPKDPGGKTFDGTGDSSFAVSEGQNRPARLGDGTPPAPAASASPAPGAAAPAAPAGGVGVQVGAFSSQAAAEAGWNKLVGQSGGALSGVAHRVVAGQADIGTVYRLQAVASDAGAASALCGKLKGAGISCQVK